MTTTLAREIHTSMSGSYDPSDVHFLLTPISLQPIDVAEKERRIQAGTFHYSAMLSPESAPDVDYMAAYRSALAENGEKLASHINILADALVSNCWLMGDNTKPGAIISLARAGTPIGILLARALRRRGVLVMHYSISIIRGRGIDLNALAHIMERHNAFVFVDGWTGKGAIARELRGTDGPKKLGLDPKLIVIADPAGVADLAATTEDYVIPSGILNGIVSGLISRSVLNEQIAADAFHGCVILDHLKAHDVSRAFIETIDSLAIETANRFARCDEHIDDEMREQLQADCEAMLRFIADRYNVGDRNRIKPGIAEATRAVLRRVPERLLVSDPADPALKHLILLATTKGVAIERLPDTCRYRAVAIIAEVGGE